MERRHEVLFRRQQNPPSPPKLNFPLNTSAADIDLFTLLEDTHLPSLPPDTLALESVFPLANADEHKSCSPREWRRRRPERHGTRSLGTRPNSKYTGTSVYQHVGSSARFDNVDFTEYDGIVWAITAPETPTPTHPTSPFLRRYLHRIRDDLEWIWKLDCFEV